MRGAGTLDKIQVKNVRSLKDTGEIELSPITLLLGENSSGKSTFLRLFPLIKQSITKRTDGPLLWAGDVDDYVDFGSFEETVTNDGSNHMILTFSFSMSNEDYYGMLPRIVSQVPQSEELINRLNGKSNIKYTITVARDSSHEYISRLEVHVDKARFEFDLGPDAAARITVDGMPVLMNVGSSEKRRHIRYYFSSKYAESEIFEYNLPSISGITDDLLQRFLDGIPEGTGEYEYTLFSYHSYAITLMISSY